MRMTCWTWHTGSQRRKAAVSPGPSSHRASCTDSSLQVPCLKVILPDQLPQAQTGCCASTHTCCHRGGLCAEEGHAYM